MQGPPIVMWTNRSLYIPRRQTRALLYRLAIRLQPVPRSKLCFLFWPDVPESKARRNLSRLLTHLRRALPKSEMLKGTNEHIWLDTEAVWSDAAAFEKLYATFKSTRCVDTLKQAIDLYRGPLLVGFSLPRQPEFEIWAARECEQREQLYLKALALLVEELAKVCAYNEAISYAQRYLVIDDFSENMHCRLMELYTAVGNRSAAVQQFKRCTTILERSLGITPLPETRAVYEAILAA